MFEVVKRDGEITEFNLGKINAAIEKAFRATKMEYNDDILGLLSLRVSADFRIRSRTARFMWRRSRTVLRRCWNRPATRR